MRPTLSLSNFASRKLHTGRVFSIMARPRRWEMGLGRVEPLTPLGDLVPLMERAIMARAEVRALGYYTHAAASALSDYRTAYHRKLALSSWLAPGTLVALSTKDHPPYFPPGEWIPLRDGDTLCCACARGAECHRRWAAPFLARAGWAVILDGEPFNLTEPA